MCGTGSRGVKEHEAAAVTTGPRRGTVRRCPRWIKEGVPLLRVWLPMLVLLLSAFEAPRGVVAIDDANELFDFPFGPDHGDQFTEKGDSPQTEISVDNFMYGNSTIESIKISSNLYIRLVDTDGNSRDIDIFEYDGDSADYLFDKMCFAENASMYYDDSGWNSEEVCEVYRFSHSDKTYSIENPVSDTDDYVRADYGKRASIHMWHEIDYFYAPQIDLYFDDELTFKLFGPDVRDPNLVCNQFMRNIKTDEDKAIATARVAKSDFSCDYGWVVTYYRVMEYENNPLTHNDIQVYVACDEKGNSASLLDNECYIVFVYKFVALYDDASGDIALLTYSGDGFNFDYLPFHESKWYERIVMESNVGDPGVYVYELIQDGSSDHVVRLPSNSQLCSNALTQPTLLPAFSTQVYTVTIPCFGFLARYEDTTITKFKLVGQSYERNLTDLDISYDEWYTEIDDMPAFWGSTEMVQIRVSSEGVDEQTVATVHFGEKEVAGFLKVVDTGSGYNVSWPAVTINESTTLTITEYEFIGGGEGYDDGTDASASLSSGDTEYIYTLSTNEAVRIELDSYQGLYVVNIGVKNTTTCADWQSVNSGYNVSTCAKALEEEYPCPTGGMGKNGAQWAHVEAEFGTLRWYLDPCCNENMTSAPGDMCDPAACDYNPGADFCIRSQPIACEDYSANVTHYVSNQCCYVSDGELIEDKDNGAGRMSLTEGSPENLLSMLRSELEPYQECCASVSSSDCNGFHELRPVVKGEYMGSNVASVIMGIHYDTADHQPYKFAPFGGVFTLLETDHNIPWTVQISTRTIGEGGQSTVVSGFAMKHGDTTFSLFRPHYSEADVMYVNGRTIWKTVFDFKNRHSPFHVIIDGVSLRRYDSGLGLEVKFLEGGVIINAFFFHNMLSLYVMVPHTFNGHMNGLLGKFDGETSNDLTPRGVMVSVDAADQQAVHYEFGESWRESLERDWIWGKLQRNLIRGDMDNVHPHVANYTLAANAQALHSVACDNNEDCIFDMGNSDGDTMFSDSYTALKNSKIRGVNAAEITELYTQQFQKSVGVGVKSLGVLAQALVFILTLFNILVTKILFQAA